VTASTDATAVVWDLAAQERTTAPMHSGKVLGLTVSPDGSTAASLGGDGLALVWNCASGDMQATFQVSISACAACADLRIWRVRTLLRCRCLDVIAGCILHVG